MSRKQNTFLNECRKFFPGCSEEDAHALVWNATAFPFAGLEHCRKQLQEASRATGRNVDAAIARAHQITEESMNSVQAAAGGFTQLPVE